MPDLSKLPIEYPHVQMGTPVRDQELSQLSSEQQQALNNLLSLAHRRGRLTQKRYEELQTAYKAACRLGLADYCPVVTIGAAFELDEKAVEKAVLAVATSRVSVCFSCN